MSFWELARSKKIAADQKARKRSASQAGLNRNNNSNNDPSGSQPLRRSARDRRPTAAAAAAQPPPPTRMSTRPFKRKELPGFESGGEHSDTGGGCTKPLRKKSKRNVTATVTSETVSTETVIGEQADPQTEPTPGPSNEGGGAESRPGTSQPTEGDQVPADDEPDGPTYQDYEKAPSPELSPADSSVDLSTKKAVIGYERGEIIATLKRTVNDS